MLFKVLVHSQKNYFTLSLTESKNGLDLAIHFHLKCTLCNASKNALSQESVENWSGLASVYSVCWSEEVENSGFAFVRILKWTNRQTDLSRVSCIKDNAQSVKLLVFSHFAVKCHVKALDLSGSDKTECTVNANFFWVWGQIQYVALMNYLMLEPHVCLTVSGRQSRSVQVG